MIFIDRVLTHGIVSNFIRTKVLVVSIILSIVMYQRRVHCQCSQSQPKHLDCGAALLGRMVLQV